MLTVALILQAAAFNKSSYYSRADGLKGEALKTALASIINQHTALSYSALWDAFRDTDCREDGKVWDIYSCTTNYRFGTDQAGSYSQEGDVYNREHSFPKSWFNDGTPMYTDLYHLYPSDGKVNGMRSNYCFGYVGSVTYQSNQGFSKLGSPSQQMRQWGCQEDKVFEPNDIYKGDLARSYFYMVTCYENQVSSWHSGMLSGSKYHAFSQWAENLLMEWSEQDQVSQKETDRIAAVYSYQKNRNPFIDFPGLEEYIWGEWKTVAFSVDDYVNPYTSAPIDPDQPTEPTDPEEPTDPSDPSNPDVEPGQMIWYESFDEIDGTGGNDGKWSGSIANASTSGADNGDWDFTSGSGGAQCVRLGTGSRKGSATTPPIAASGHLVLEFMAAAWGSDNETINLSISKGTLSQTTITLTQQEWTTYRIDITDAQPGFTITFEAAGSSNNRFFLDEVCIYAANETAIDAIHTPITTAATYDLSGRRVSTARMPKGIVVKGGKKIVVL